MAMAKASAGTIRRAVCLALAVLLVSTSTAAAAPLRKLGPALLRAAGRLGVTLWRRALEPPAH